MQRITVVIIGAGQAGLAVSELLTGESVDHVILGAETPRKGWRSRRWIRCGCSRNWMNGLPDWSYDGPDRGGFMSAASVVEYLDQYALSFQAPVIRNAQVHSVRRARGRFAVSSDAGCWTADAVVIATSCWKPSRRCCSTWPRRAAPVDPPADAGLLSKPG